MGRVGTRGRVGATAARLVWANCLVGPKGLSSLQEGGNAREDEPEEQRRLAELVGKVERPARPQRVQPEEELVAEDVHVLDHVQLAQLVLVHRLSGERNTCLVRRVTGE